MDQATKSETMLFPAVHVANRRQLLYNFLGVLDNPDDVLCWSQAT